jgi:hypothetical protein
LHDKDWGRAGKPHNIEQRFPKVLVRAIHDDTTILGDTKTIFSEGGARQKLTTDLANVGSELHEGKAEAYGMIPEDRAQSPEGIKQPFATWTDPVTGISASWFWHSGLISTALFKESRNSAAMLLLQWPTTHACTVRTS